MDNHVIELLRTKGIKMVHINVRSLFNKIDQIRTMFNGFDVIIISESWLTPAIPDSSIAIPGYNLVRQDRLHQTKRRGGGLCVFVDSKFIITLLNEPLNKSTSDF